MNAHRWQALVPGSARPAVRFSLASLLCAALLLTGCVFGGGKKKAATQAPAPGTPRAALAPAAPAASAGTSAPATIAASTAFSGTPTTVAPAGTPVVPVTPAPATPSPTPAPPTPSPTPVVRTVDGLQIQDIAFLGQVAVDGGLRIRATPTLDGAVVGSLAQGAPVNVTGKVLNGAEAETGKGTVWYVVGVNQYIYGADGYVTAVQGAATPAPQR